MVQFLCKKNFNVTSGKGDYFEVHGDHLLMGGFCKWAAQFPIQHGAIVAVLFVL